MGRPTKHSPELEARLLNAIRAGNTIKTACAYAGIHNSQLYRWKADIAAFAEALSRAEAECEVRTVAALQRAASGYEKTETRTSQRYLVRRRKVTYPDGRIEESEEPVLVTETTTTISQEFDWRAGLEWLKRRRKDDWGDRQRIDVNNLTDEQVLALLLRDLGEDTDTRDALPE